MRHAALGFVIASALALPAAAADWYVDPAGSASGTGSSASPINSLANAIPKAHSGDRILLKAGATHRIAASVNVPSGVTVTAYGTGTKPEITAAQSIVLAGTWATNAAVRTAALSTQATALYVNGTFQPLARYPNSGWLTVDSGTTADAIVDAALASRPGVAAGRWVGAQVRWRRWSWWFETRPITAQASTTTLTLGATGKFSDGHTGIGSSYFIDNALDELDAPGEWFWGNGLVYLYPPAGVDPATMKVEVVTNGATVNANGSTFSGLAFRRFKATALNLNGKSTVDSCTFEQLEGSALTASWNAYGSQIRNNAFRDVRDCGIAWNEDPASVGGTIIERNTFERIGMREGYGGNGSWHSVGVKITNGHAVTVRLNKLVDVGYAGIILGSPNQVCSRNVIVRAMGTLNDGAGIYVTASGNTVSENIVLDTVGNLATSHPWWPLGHGIWPEFIGDYRNQQILNNTVYGSNGHGLFLQNEYAATISGNVFADNRLAGISLSRNNSTKPATQDHVITGNTLAVVVPTRRVARTENLQYPTSVEPPTCITFEPGIDYTGVNANMSGTRACSPVGAKVFRAKGSATTDYDTVSAWYSAASAWADSGAKLARRNAIVLFNDTESVKTMTVPTGYTWTLIDGTAVGTTVTLNPFRSVVLTTTSTVPSTPPYYAASGQNYRGTTASPITASAAEVAATTTDPATPPTDPATSPASIAASGSSGSAGSGSGCGIGSGIGLVGLGLLAVRRRRG